MTYERYNQANTETTRHLRPEDEATRGLTGYLQGARERSGRFAETTAQLREIRTEIDELGRAAHDRPTGVLSGGDIDIAYHYLGMALGIAAALYSLLGTIFALHGGSAAWLAPVVERWAAGPGPALADALLTTRTLLALLLQGLLFVVLVGTRRTPQSWQHWAALGGSAALTYAGWSSLLLDYGTAPVAAFTTTIPAALVGAALGWGLLRAAYAAPLPRPLLIVAIMLGVVAGALGTSALIHWTGLLLALSADQVARRVMVVG